MKNERKDKDRFQTLVDFSMSLNEELTKEKFNAALELFQAEKQQNKKSKHMVSEYEKRV